VYFTQVSLYFKAAQYSPDDNLQKSGIHAGESRVICPYELLLQPLHAFHESRGEMQ